MRIFLLTLFGLILLSCEDNSHGLVTIPRGTYAGFFLRTTNDKPLPYSNVMLVFDENTFAGTSDKSNYPAICAGDYKVAGKEIEFSSPCGLTSSDDQRLILTGKFKVALIGDDLLLTRTYPDNTRDIYRLTRSNAANANAASSN
jgi:hypothetical protein